MSLKCARRDYRDEGAIWYRERVWFFLKRKIARRKQRDAANPINQSLMR